MTFSDESMDRSAQLCVQSAKAHGADEALIYPRSSLIQQPFYFENQELLDCSRGLGFWAWKPYVIDYALSCSSDGDIVIYSDAGVEIINNLNYITDRMTSDIWLFGNQYEHAHWCKRDIVEAVMPGAPWPSFGKQCQASVIFIRNTEKSRRFVKEWLDLCTVKHLIDDSPSVAPNHPEFRENRHDQAILTTLAYRDGIPLHWWPASYNDGAFVYERGNYPDEGYPVLFAHHRGVKTGERAA
jgi:hypothetical protein